MIFKDFFIRDMEADTYRETFLISAIVSIFAIRVFLKFTNYPILGVGDIHVAHMLWGGLFMMAAIIISLSFLSKTASNIAALLGGIGFGAFIDELGKFITSDNDYFFRPTVAFIYIIFVLVYLISRVIPYRRMSKKEYLVNAIETIKESAINDFDVEEERRAKAYLRKCDPDDPTVHALKKLLSHIDAAPMPPPGIFTRIKIFMRNVYYTLAGSGIVVNVIIAFLAVQAVLTLSQLFPLFTHRPSLRFSEWGMLYSSILAGTFALIGLFALRVSKEEGYRFFRLSMLITILLTEFFAFMRSQWYEVIGLAFNLFILAVINYAMIQEKQKNKAETA